MDTAYIKQYMDGKNRQLTVYSAINYDYRF